MSFNPIVGINGNAAKPHALPSSDILQKGDLLLFDAGIKYKRYCSDRTRTGYFSKDGFNFAKKQTFKDKELQKIYDIVLNAQLLGLKEIAPGKSGKEVDAPVREYIKNAGYGQYFGHGLGHGVGLEIHELPRLSPLSPTEKLEENMLVTDEPGIYLPDFGGVRIEDTVLVTANGCQPLTKSDKRLIEIM